MQPRTRLQQAIQNRDKSELEAIERLKSRLDSAVSDLKSLQSLPPPPFSALPRRPTPSSNPGLLLEEVQGLLKAQIQRDRGEIITEYSRKSLKMQLLSSNSAILPQEKPKIEVKSERNSLNEEGKSLSRYPTATSLLSPKAFSADIGGKVMQKELEMTANRVKTQEKTIEILLKTQEEMRNRIEILEKQANNPIISPIIEGNKPVERRKYMQELYSMRKSHDTARLKRWVEREQHWLTESRSKLG